MRGTFLILVWHFFARPTYCLPSSVISPHLLVGYAKKIGDAVDKTNNKKYINTEVKMNVMVKKDIHVENRLVEIEVPEDFLGKDVEITIKEKEVKTNTNELEDFFSRFNYDLSDLVFNREELHER